MHARSHVVSRRDYQVPQSIYDSTFQTWKEFGRNLFSVRETCFGSYTSQRSCDLELVADVTLLLML